MSTGRVKRQSTSELMDDWLDSQGLYRKHIANDSSCLFRAVSEQLFNTQVRHMEVRTSCADYMEKNSAKFSALIEDSFENYIASVRNPKEWGGQIELMAMSSLFKCDFSVFQDVGKAMYKVTNNGYSKIVVLCQTSGNHYDSVYPKSFIQIAAISQSIVYEILYKKVFVMGEEVDFAVETMLHDKVYAKSRKDSTASVDSNPPLQFGDSSEENDSKDVGSEIRQALARGFPPFPYKVAKALDASIYRNVEFDVWNESKKGEVIYEPGVKCLVRLDKNKPETYHAHIQEMLPDLGPVTLYIVELGKKQTVPYECLEPLPANKNYNTTGAYYQKQMMNGSPTEFENYKGKKKLFKKTKYKFSVSIPRGQSIPPRFQSQQQSQSPYNNHGMGRERELPNQGMPKSNSPNFKWVATVSPNHGYRGRNPEGNKYVLPELTYAVHDNHNYKISALTRNNEKPLVQLSNTASPALPWPKSSRSPNISNSGPGSNDGDPCSESMANHGHLPKMKKQMQEISNESSLQLSANNNLDIHSSNVVDNRPKDLSTTSPPPPLMVNQQFINQDNSVMTTPQPVAIFPYQYVGVCLPYETPVNSVNYGTPRSRDPHGSDLPLHDLATLRFFYNLGHDYFRSATIIPMATNQYHSAVWSYGPQLAFQAVGGYGTPASGLGNDNETMPDSPGSNGMGLPLGDPPTSEVLLDANSPTKFYEPTYFYDVSHINLVSSPFQPPMAIDYSSIPSPPTLHSGVGGEFKEGLVLNEQGVLSLSNTTQGLPTNSSKAQSNCHNQQQQVYQHNVSSSSMRFRSDSATSNRNSSATINNWQQNAMNSKFDNLNHAILNSTEPNVMNQPMYSSTKTDSNLPSQRYQSRVSSSKPIPTNYNAPPHRHHHPPPTSFPVIQAGSPIMAASSPTVYTGLGSPTTYYSSPPTTALLYPPPHVPQQISYMTSTAQ